MNVTTPYLVAASLNIYVLDYKTVYTLSIISIPHDICYHVNFLITLFTRIMDILATVFKKHQTYRHFCESLHSMCY